RTERDNAWYDYQLRLRQFNKENEEPPTLPNMLPFIREEGQINPLNFNKTKIDRINNVLSSLNKMGGLRKGVFLIPDTPENRKKAGKYTIIDETTTPSGPGGVAFKTGKKMLRVEGGYNPEHFDILKEAREFLG